MDKGKQEEFRKRLEEERAGIVDEMRLLHEEVTDPRLGEMSHAPTHLADLSADDHEVDVSIQGLERGSEELAEISEALPYAALCIECKRNQERERPAR